MSNYDGIFAELIQKAEALGYGLDTRELTKDLLIKLSSNSDSVKKLRASSEFSKRYEELNEMLSSYLEWSMPYLFLDDADDTIIQRDPRQEKAIINKAQGILQEFD